MVILQRPISFRSCEKEHMKTNFPVLCVLAPLRESKIAVALRLISFRVHDSIGLRL